MDATCCKNVEAPTAELDTSAKATARELTNSMTAARDDVVVLFGFLNAGAVTDCIISSICMSIAASVGGCDAADGCGSDNDNDGCGCVDSSHG